MHGDVFVLDVARTPLATAGTALAEVLPSRLVAGLLRQLPAGDLCALVLAGDGSCEAVRHALASSGRTARASWLVQRGGIGAAEAIRQGVLQVAGDAGAADGVCVVAGGYATASRYRARGVLDMLAAVTHPQLPPRAAADLLAARHGLTVAALDDWSERSRQAARAAQAQVQAQMRAQPQPVTDLNGLVILADDCVSDDCVGGTSAQTAARMDEPADAWRVAPRLAPCQRELARLHTVNHVAPQVDGAALVLLGCATAAERLRLRPRARLAASVTLDAGPAQGFSAAHAAVRGALARAGWTAAQLDMLEIHDGFAAQALAAAHELSLPLDRINPLGGALVHGDAGAAAGAVSVGRLLSRLNEGTRGVAVAADAAGHAVAFALEGLA